MPPVTVPDDIQDDAAQKQNKDQESDGDKKENDLKGHDTQDTDSEIKEEKPEIERVDEIQDDKAAAGEQPEEKEEESSTVSNASGEDDQQSSTTQSGEDEDNLSDGEKKRGVVMLSDFKQLDKPPESPSQQVKKVNQDYQEFLDRKLRDIERCLNGEANIEDLRNFATSRGGIPADEMRKRVWPILANIDHEELNPEDLPDDEACKNDKSYRQVELDVGRTFKRFPPNIDEQDQPLYKEQLIRIIMRLLIKYPGLHYYQGYHDIVITFLLVVGEDRTYQIMDRLTQTHFKDFMERDMTSTTHKLNFMYPLV